jgi:hypothetical protein
VAIETGVSDRINYLFNGDNQETAFQEAVKPDEAAAAEYQVISLPFSKDLIDPNDLLATSPELLTNAIEVIDEIRANISDQHGNIPMVIDTDPEWFAHL